MCSITLLEDFITYVPMPPSQCRAVPNFIIQKWKHSALPYKWPDYAGSIDTVMELYIFPALPFDMWPLIIWPGPGTVSHLYYTLATYGVINCPKHSNVNIHHFSHYLGMKYWLFRDKLTKSELSGEVFISTCTLTQNPNKSWWQASCSYSVITHRMSRKSYR